MKQCYKGGGGGEQGIRHFNIFHKDGKRITEKKSKSLLLWHKEKIKHVQTIVFLSSNKDRKQLFKTKAQKA